MGRPLAEHAWDAPHPLHYDNEDPPSGFKSDGRLGIAESETEL
jgi:hypothetical protein